MKTSQILRDAKATIQKYGWMKGLYGDERRGFCILGAVMYQMEAPETGITTAAIDELAKVVGIPKQMSAQIAWWNDSPARTKAQVYDVFDQAIANAQAREAIQEVQSWAKAEPPAVDIKKDIDIPVTA